MSKDKITIVDVRTLEEFMGGNVAGSINISLQEIPPRLKEIESLQQPIIFCCSSGNPSGHAAAFLKSCDLECENGGSWMDLNYNS
ncbi:MAG: rhodanese-like domain-containing protein [Ferruginibacter sp.]